MARRTFRSLIADERGAVAATYALSLFALIAIAGIGFDYARLATMHTELQDAADQAALAAATQLDGQANAINRATAQASNLVSNKTLLANDNNGTATTVASVTFYSTVADAESGSNGFTDNSQSPQAHFVRVVISSREAYYALTPVVAAISSGDVGGAAIAGVGSSICKVPPVFMCNPAEATDPSFTISNYVGKGIRLIANTGGSTYGSGNFGYLEANQGNGAQAIAQSLGRTAVPGDCTSLTSVTTKPGAQVSVLDALNTRFDIYANGLNNACPSNADCPPSANTRKDVLQKGNGCAFTTGNGNGWQQPSNAYGVNLPVSATALTQAQINAIAPMGYPRDLCHAVSSSGICASGNIGDGTWDRNAYFKSNPSSYPAGFDISGTFGTLTPTRYAVYKYEAANAATRLRPESSGGLTSRPQPVCQTPGVAVGSTVADRRVLSMAVINCGGGLNGSTSGLVPKKWVDVFLVEPSLNRARTSQGDLYVEVIGETGAGGGVTAAPQYVRRDKPYLIK